MVQTSHSLNRTSVLHACSEAILHTNLLYTCEMCVHYTRMWESIACAQAISPIVDLHGRKKAFRESRPVDISQWRQ